MPNSRISLSLEEIDGKIADHRKRAKEHIKQADDLERLKKLALDLAKPESPEDPVLPYLGMSARMAAIKYLNDKGAPAGTTEIATALVQGGIETNSKTFYRTLFNTLKAASKKKSSELVKIGNQWALKGMRDLFGEPLGGVERRSQE